MKKTLSVLFIMLLVVSVAAVASAKVVLTAIVGISKSEPAYQSHLKVLERFYKENPDIEIQFDYIAHDTYHTKMQAMVVAGNLPDILHLWPGKRTGYITDKGMALDLRELLKRDGILDTLPAIQKQAQGPNGEIYEVGVPSIPYSNVVYANDKLMQKLGLTFPKDINEFIGQAKTIAAAGYRPLVFGDKSDWVMQSCMLSLIASRVGGMEWFMNAVTGKKASFKDQQFVDSINWIKKMADSGLMSKSEVDTTREQAMAMLTNDEAVYYINGTWDVTNFVNNAPEEAQKNISLHFFPEIPGQKTMTESSPTAAPTGYGMNAKLEGEKKEAAWKWIKAQADPAYAELHVAAGSVPLYLKKDISNLFSNDLVKRLYRHLVSIKENLYVIDDKLDSEGVNSIVNPGLQEVIMGTITPEQLAAKYEDWVAKNDSNRK